MGCVRSQPGGLTLPTRRREQARDTYQESLRSMVAEQSAANQNLITCLESNTRVLEECHDELRHSRMERNKL